MDIFFYYIDYISENLENNYLIIFLIYLFLLITFYSFSLPGSPILSITSGFFFGFYIGFLINIFAILIGSYIFVYIAKNILKKLFSNFYLKYSNKLTTLIKNSSYEYLIIFRLIQGNPLFIQNLCFAFLKISRTKFIISSLIGFTPLIFIFSYFGSKLSHIYDLKNFEYKEIFSNEFIIFILIFFIFLLFRIVFKHFKYIKSKTS